MRGALRRVQRQPFAEQCLQFVGQAQRRIAGTTRTCVRCLFEHRFHVAVVERRNDRRYQYTYRHACIRQRANGLDAPMRCARARFQFRRQMVVQRVHRYEHLHQLLAGHRCEDVQVTLHHRILGDDGAGVVALGQHFQRSARQFPTALDRLIRVCIAADIDRANHITRPRQFQSQHLGQIALGAQLRFEIQTRREIEIAVRRAGEAIDAAVLATTIRIECLIEMDVGRVVARDDAARAFLGHFGAWARRLLVQQQALPAVVFRVVANGFEAPLRIGGSAATFVRL